MEIKFPTVTDIIFIGEGCYDINNYYNETYLISTYWNFTKEKYCPILFKTGQWFFINEYLEIVYDEWYYSIGIIHHGHTCYQPPIANEVVIEDKGFLVTKNDGIQDDINASGNYKKDVNGHILPEEYKNMSNDELIEEYTRLKEYELDGRVIRIGELSIKSHDASAQKSAIRQELENRGLKLTRSYDGNKTVYGYDNAEKAPDSNKTHESENANKTPGSDKPNGEKTAWRATANALKDCIS